MSKRRARIKKKWGKEEKLKVDHRKNKIPVEQKSLTEHNCLQTLMQGQIINSLGPHKAK